MSLRLWIYSFAAAHCRFSRSGGARKPGVATFFLAICGARGGQACGPAFSCPRCSRRRRIARRGQVGGKGPHATEDTEYLEARGCTSAATSCAVS